MSTELSMDSTFKEKLVAFYLYATLNTSEDILEKVADEFIEKLEATKEN